MNYTKTIFCDIDGTLIEHFGSHYTQITRDPVILENTIKTIRSWDQKGYNIILTTGRRESARKVTVDQLESLGIFYDQLIMGIGGGSRVLINDRKSDGTDTAFAYNIDRNSCLPDIDLPNHIQDALDEYKEVIDGAKPDKLSVSRYRVEKPWGYELWLELNEFYAYKLIHMEKGNRCSLQSHDYKIEANFVIEGEAEVLLENDNGEMESKIYKPGDGWTVPLGRKHRVIARESYTALEVSTPHLNDVVRYQDDTNRVSGKILGEHKDNV